MPADSLSLAFATSMRYFFFLFIVYCCFGVYCIVWGKSVSIVSTDKAERRLRKTWWRLRAGFGESLPNQANNKQESRFDSLPSTDQSLVVIGAPDHVGFLNGVYSFTGDPTYIYMLLCFCI
ncbi:hypothetical protein EON65_23675 [archaeon]|nr:MAG: hypothetical protein EON65_23675 [archaeon]